VIGVAHLLTVLRMLLAVALPASLVRAITGDVAPLLLALSAVATDFLDGRLARRAGRASRVGAWMDVGADVAFVLSGTVTAAALGMTSWLVPIAIALSSSTFFLASCQRASAGGLAYNRLGHAAGIANYGLVLLVAVHVWRPLRVVPSLLAIASEVTVALNLGAVLARGLALR